METNNHIFCLRRVISKTLDVLVGKIIDLNPYQRGFLMTPGTFIKINIVEGILQTSMSQNKSACLVFLDITKAFDSIGHNHLCSTIQNSPLPTSIQKLLVNMLIDNTTCIHFGGRKTKKYIYKTWCNARRPSFTLSL